MHRRAWVRRDGCGRVRLPRRGGCCFFSIGIVLGIIGAAFALALLLTDFSLALVHFMVDCGFVAVYAAFSWYNAMAHNRRDPQVVFVLGGTAQIVLITLLMAPFTYVAAAANVPMQDAALMAIDKAAQPRLAGLCEIRE